jgi:hypothetical protein
VFELSDFYGFCKENQVDVIPFAGCPCPGAAIRDGDFYAVFLDFTQIHSTRLLRGICCHEMGHVATGALHKVDSPFELAERSEYRANRWAAQQFLTQEEFQEAFDAGYTEYWQLAEFFDMPERDIRTALTYWTQRRGVNFNKS